MEKLLKKLMDADKTNVKSPKDFDDLLDDLIVDALKIKQAIRDVKDAIDRGDISHSTTIIKATYNPRDKTVSLNASAKDFDEKYLKHVLEMHDIPQDSKLVFLKDKPQPVDTPRQN